MVSIKLAAFTGERPRIIPRQLPDNAAVEALNVRLDDGGLTAVNRPQIEAVVEDSAGHQTIYRHGDAWLSWADVVHAAPGPVDSSRLYYTGDGAPKMLADGDVYELALPPATTPLVATLDGSGSGDVTTRLYVYTWVTEFGEESEPSPASNEVPWQPGYDVILSDFETVPSDRGITHQRIYRTQSGETGTYLYLVAERAASDTDFTDDVPVDGLQEPLPSADWNAPPADLAGLTAFGNGMMAAFVGNRLYFCEPYRPHAWPEKYALQTDRPIVGLGSVGDLLYVLTTGKPWVCSGSHPSTISMVQTEANLPCINGRGIADLGFALCYPSTEGLVRCGGDGSIGYVTQALWDRDDWARLSPETFVAGQHLGRYAAFYDTTDGDGNVIAGMLSIAVDVDGFFTRLNIRGDAAFHDLESGALFYLAHGTEAVWRADPPNAVPDSYYRRSKPFILPAPRNFGAIQIDSDRSIDEAALAAYQVDLAAYEAANADLIENGTHGEFGGSLVGEYVFAGDALGEPPTEPGTVQVGVIADGVRRATVTTLNKAVRLPGGFTARTWAVDVYGTLPITQVVIGETMADIAAA